MFLKSLLLFIFMAVYVLPFEDSFVEASAGMIRFI